MKTRFFLLAILLSVASVATSQTMDSFQDKRDGKRYKTVKLGNQVWMAENLNYQTEEGSWCYRNKPENCSIYGRLYTWEKAQTVCPEGWHLPSREEWTTLYNYLDINDTTLGGMLKETGIKHWCNPNSAATNETNFNALPGGCKKPNLDEFSGKGLSAKWWLSDMDITQNRHSKIIMHDKTDVYSAYSSKHFAYSVRCVKDNKVSNEN